MLLSSRVSILVVVGIVVVVGGFLISATGANTEGGVISILVVVGLLSLPIGAMIFKRMKKR